MDFTPVESSNLSEVGYDRLTRILGVRFKKGGGLYHYLDVGPETHDALMAADSKGKFLALDIKGRFNFERIEEA